MSNLHQTIANDDFVWDAISSHAPGRTRGGGDCIKFNCPMCISRGETPDTKFRCDVRRWPDGLGVKCWNCNFTTRWRVGDTLSGPMRSFLGELGMSEDEVKKVNFKAFKYKRLIDRNPAAQSVMPIKFELKFDTMALPLGSRSISDWSQDDVLESDLIDVVNYLWLRGEVIARSTEFYWCPQPEYRRRLIIPYLFNDRIVGFTSRAIDSHDKSRYVNHIPADFLFNNRVLGIPSRKVIIILEGVLDALAIDGISPSGSSFSERQLLWLKQSSKRKILVADRDLTGGKLINQALDNEWDVSFPRLTDGVSTTSGGNWWDQEIKDSDQAVRKYGRLYTIQSILTTATSNSLKIKTLAKKYAI